MTNDKKRIAILALTKGGRKLAQHLATALPGAAIDLGPGGIKTITQDIWHEYRGIVFIMATGIVVRTIAPLLHNKKSDPGIVVVDEAGKYAVSLLSGHLGGANELAKRISKITAGQAVITTASDTLDLTPIDLWAKQNNLQLTQGSFTTVSTQLVNSGQLNVWLDIDGPIPPEFKRTASAAQADLIISNKLHRMGNATVLCPKNLIIGVGCNRGVKATQIAAALAETCQEKGLARQAIKGLASIDLKSDEKGLLDFCRQEDLPITFYPATQLNTMNTSRSEVVFKATGAYGVAEPAALLRAETNKLLYGKMKWTDVTIAIAEIPLRLTANYQ